ncbi:MAG: hypothetical protein ACX98W_22325 [bacterium]
MAARRSVVLHIVGEAVDYLALSLAVLLLVVVVLALAPVILIAGLRPGSARDRP